MQAERKSGPALVVAIDGPAGAGKSTVARQVARRLGLTLVDTGAVYRTVALLAQRAGVSWDDGQALCRIVEALSIRFEFESDVNHVFVGDEDVTDAIRAPDISAGASVVSAHPPVRAGLLDLQRRLAGEQGAVLEGRDIGTVVCPQAPVKIYLDAAPEERARRRYEELGGSDGDVDYAQVLSQVIQRDTQDMNRAVAPLKPADDANIIDSTSMGTAAVIEHIVELAKATALNLPQ